MGGNWNKIYARLQMCHIQIIWMILLLENSGQYCILLYALYESTGSENKAK